jgi:hypothetical protein
MNLYLIAHKVRGEPALDVAVKMEMADGPWWIIPTSGHRAYPYWHSDLDGLLEEANICPQAIEMPADLPDHYPTSISQRKTLDFLTLEDLDL